MKIQEKYMYRAIQQGVKALGYAAPNPAVGAVLVAGDRIIGEGWTSPYGGPHAEVNAVHSVQEPSALKEATLYVTLEPCSHFGKTPPCSDLIIEKQIPEVVIGLKDPFDKVAGRGIQKLKDAGIKVSTGILEKECREHHRRFLSLHEKKRPYIVLKWATSADGYLAPDARLRAASPEPYWISNSAARSLVHFWRGQEQAILVGTGTAIADNPRLDTRLWEGPQPLRILIDREAKVPGEYHLKSGSWPTLVICEKAGKPGPNLEYYETRFHESLPQKICDILAEREVSSLLIEGGAITHQAFIDAGLWDEARIITGPKNFKSGLQAPSISGLKTYSGPLGNNHVAIFRNDS